MEVPNTSEAVAAALTSLGGKPMICQKTGKEEGRDLKENTKRLEAAAKKAGRELHLLEVEDESQGEANAETVAEALVGAMEALTLEPKPKPKVKVKVKPEPAPPPPPVVKYKIRKNPVAQ